MGILSGKKVAMIIAPKNFRDEEYFQPKVVLQSRGVEISTVADTNEEEATGVNNGKARIDKPLKGLNVNLFDGIIFVGGPGATAYFKNKEAIKIAKKASEADKVIGAICIAPSILANAGILSGKKVSCFSEEKQNLENKGARVLKQPVTIDGKLVTASGPEAAMEFGQKLVKVLNK